MKNLFLRLFWYNKYYVYNYIGTILGNKLSLTERNIYACKRQNILVFIYVRNTWNISVLLNKSYSVKLTYSPHIKCLKHLFNINNNLLNFYTQARFIIFKERKITRHVCFCLKVDFTINIFSAPSHQTRKTTNNIDTYFMMIIMLYQIIV
jgi:hypothetical protein